MVLEKLKEGLQAAIKKIIGAQFVDEAVIKEFVKELQRTLIMADVKVSLVLDVSTRIEKRARDETPPPGLSRKDQVIKILYEELSALLGEESKFELPANRVSVVLMMGVQGSGKTTVTGKLARFLIKKGYKPGLVAADTFRPGAYTQLKMLGDAIGVEVFGGEGTRNSVDVAAGGVAHFRSSGKNVIVVDTAGRHKEEKSLLEEMNTISEKVKPDFALLVVDGTIGQQCYAQAEAFHRTVPVGGIIVTKLDGAAKGGGALAATAATGARIYFLGTGERVDDLELFSPTRFAGKLLGLGDLKALLERAKELEVEADEKQVKRIMSGKITINDFLAQIEQVKKMGSLRKILELIPGLSSAIPTQDLDALEGKMGLWRSMIQSMTKQERENPDVINASRMKRIARGSGNGEKEVRELLARFRQAKAVMKASKGRAMRQFLRRLPPE